MRYIFLAAIFFLTSISVTSQPLTSEIVFDGGDQIYSIRANGTGQVNLTNDLGTYRSPSWSPDGTKILYTRNYLIGVMNADGTNRNSLGIAGSSPDWSPNGSKIAFDSISSKYTNDIFVMNADGSNLTQLTAHPDYESSYAPDWSPDGSKIVFLRNYRVHVINADGTGQTALTNSSIWEYRATWSPDGSKIAFSRGNPDKYTNLYVMNADGTGQAAITSCSNCYDFSPTWSPDGTKLAFISNRDGPYTVYVVNVDGTNIARITQNAFDSFYPDWKRTAPAVQHQLSGRVTTPAGRGVSRGRVTLDDGAGNFRSAITNPFGYFRLENVPTGTYNASVKSKSYTFASRVVSVSTSITDLDFVAIDSP